jgi:putative phage-type endonuclease
MGKVLIENIDQNYEAWIAQKRTKSIGSGDIATICGANDYQTPLKLWAIKTGREDPDPENDHMFWGKLMEAPIAALAARRLSLKLQYANTLYAHDDHEWARATPDYFGNLDPAKAFTSELELDDPTAQVIVECKNVSWRARQAWEDATPLYPTFQVIWQMGIHGRIKSAVIAPLIGGDIIEGFTPRVVKFDDRIFAQMFEQAEKFKWHLDHDVPPAATTGDGKLLNKLIGDLQEKSVDLQEAEVAKAYEAKDYAEQRKELEAKVKELKEREESLKLQIRQAMGQANRAKAGQYTVNVSKIPVRSFTVAARVDTRITIK